MACAIRTCTASPSTSSATNSCTTRARSSNCSHGLTSLYLAGLLTLVDAVDTLRAMGLALFVGFGDSPSRSQGSIDVAAAASPLADELSAQQPQPPATTR